MPSFKRSETTSRLVSYLSAFGKGTGISYDDLTTAAGELIDARSHNLRYARLILEREHNQVWIAVPPKVGLYRLQDAEIAQRLGAWWMAGARRKLDRGGEQSGLVDTQTLDLDEAARFAVNSIQRELAFRTLSKGTHRQLEKVARGTSNDLPSFNVVEWAISLMPRKPATPT